MKYLISILVFLSLHTSLSGQIDEWIPMEISAVDWEHEKILADQLFGASLFQEAIPYYRVLAMGSQDGEIPLRLGYSCYMEKRFSETISALQEKSDLSPLGVFLLGSSWRHLKEYAKASEALKACLTFSEIKDEACFELGLTYLSWGKNQEARQCFQQLRQEAADLPMRQAATLALVRIALLEKEYMVAQQLFDQLEKEVCESVIQKELLYLKGEMAYLLEDYEKAAMHFEKALPKRNVEVAPWYKETLYHLGWSYFKAATISQELKSKQTYLELAEKNFRKLGDLSKDEKAFLALGQVYLYKANLSLSSADYQKAEEVLSQREVFNTHEGKAEALFLRAQNAPLFIDRDRFYDELTDPSQKQNPFYPRAWYLKGLNTLDHATVLLKTGKKIDSVVYFKQASEELLQAFHLLKDQEPKQAGNAIKYYLKACYFQDQFRERLAGLKICDEIIALHPAIMAELENPEEIYFMKGVIAAQIWRVDGESSYWDLAQKPLKSIIELFPASQYCESTLFLLGLLAHEKGEYQDSRQYLISLVEKYPQSTYACEALFLVFSDSEKMGENGRPFLRQLLENYPQSSRAAEAYFYLYRFCDYLNGDKQAIRHLQNFKKKYPETPLLLNAHYLIALDSKRDKRSENGKWLRKKNLKEVADAFQEVELLFLSLSDKIPSEHFNAYLTLYYRAKLERALANSAIAEGAQGAKKAIYEEYAIGIFQDLIKEIEEKKHLALLEPENPFPRIQEEYLFGLAQTYLKSGNEAAAEGELAKMLDKYKQSNITKGYFLSRVWFEKGLMAQKNNQFEKALGYFQQAEDAGKGKVLTSEQKLSLWIEQSLCFRSLHQYDQAMLLLSKVINSDVASGLRLKAMFLRAEIYELQGRHELAKRQLETIAKKGGDWSSKALGKLEKEYGFE